MFFKIEQIFKRFAVKALLALLQEGSPIGTFNFIQIIALIDF